MTLVGGRAKEKHVRVCMDIHAHMHTLPTIESLERGQPGRKRGYGLTWRADQTRGEGITEKAFGVSIQHVPPSKWEF